MQKLCGQRSFIPQIFRVFLFFLLTPFCLSQAMESTEDPHDKVLKGILQNHHFTYYHFMDTEDNTIPLYDIAKTSSERIPHLHKENLSNFQTILLASQLLKSSIPLNTDIETPSWSYWDAPWYALDTLTSLLPRIGWPFYVSPPTLPADLPSSNLEEIHLTDSLQGFHLLSLEDQETVDASLSDSSGIFRPSRSSPAPWRLGLSLDGGGVRGIVEAILIAKIEQETNRPISQVFDLIGGTSIGGIGALLLTASYDGKTPKMSGENLVDLIENHAGDIFPQRSRYNVLARLWDEIESLFYSRYPPEPLRNLLKRHLGELTFQQSLTRVLVTAVNADTASPRIFDSANPSDQIYQRWDVGMSTSAAPTYFDKHRSITDQQVYIDGGVAKNNPALDVLHGLSIMSAFSLSQTTILSLGTGNMPLGKIPTNAGISSVGSIIDAILMTQSKSVEMTLEELLPGTGQYFRANPSFDVVISLDQPDVESIRLLKEGAESQYEIIEQFLASDPVRKRLEADIE